MTPCRMYAKNVISSCHGATGGGDGAATLDPAMASLIEPERLNNGTNDFGTVCRSLKLGRQARTL